MQQPQSITSLPDSPEEDRRRRTRQYLIGMSIRTACVIACFFVRGWWLLLPVMGAVVLPWVSVLLANVAARGRARPLVLRPGSIRRLDDR